MLLNFQTNKSDRQHIFEMFIRKSHHQNLGVFVLLQQIFNNSLRLATINATYSFIFPCETDKNVLEYLNQRLFPKCKNFLREAMEDCKNMKWSFLLIDCSPSQHSNFRTRNFILRGKDSKVYILKNEACRNQQTVIK